MKQIHRLAITAVGAAVMVVLTSAVATAAGFLGPGRYTSSFAYANASWSTIDGGYTNVSVNRDTFVFRPKHHNGGSPSMQHATIVNVNTSTPSVTGSACFVVPDQAFVESNGVQAASLSVTVDETNFCPGFAAPLSGVVSAQDGKGVPPPAAGLPLPLTIKLSWSGNGLTTSSTDRNRMSCGSFRADTTSDTNSSVADAGGSLTFKDGTVLTLAAADFGYVNNGTSRMDISGSLNPLCLGK